MSDNATSDYYDYADDEEEGWPLYVRIIIGVVIGIIGVTNLVGNFLTIIAFAIDRKLRTVANYYILNLAVTDLIIGISSIPFYGVYTVMDFYWPFGYNFCKAWSVIDFWVCAESAVTICLISWDRLQMVRKGANYIQWSTAKRAYIMIGVSWVLTFFLYSPAIIAFDIWRGYRVVESDDCDVEFSSDFIYIMITAFIEFLIPFSLVAGFSLALYLSIRRRSRKVAAMGANGINTADKGAKTSDPQTKVVVVATITKAAQPPVRKQKEAVNREKKAIRSLVGLVAAFFICWTPYTISTIILALCEDCIGDDVYELFNWLLWANSSLNSFMYAYTNERFRENYKRILLCKCLRRPTGSNFTRVRPLKKHRDSDDMEESLTMG